MHSLETAWEEQFRILQGKTETAKLERFYRHTFSESIFKYLVEGKINLLFRSYFKKIFFPRRVAQYWKSLLRGAAGPPFKEIFKAELETAKGDLVCCWGWWGMLIRIRALVVPCFPKSAMVRWARTLHFALWRPLSGSDTSNQAKTLLWNTPCEKAFQLT